MRDLNSSMQSHNAVRLAMNEQNADTSVFRPSLLLYRAQRLIACCRLQCGLKPVDGCDTNGTLHVPKYRFLFFQGNLLTSQYLHASLLSNITIARLDNAAAVNTE